MGEQDIDRELGTAIEQDDRSMVPAMADFGDPAIDDRDAATIQISADIGGNLVSIGKDRQRIGPIEEQPSLIVRLRPGPDEAPMLAGNFEAIAIWARYDRPAPAFSEARNIRHLINNAIAQDDAARRKAVAIVGEDRKIINRAGNAIGAGIDESDRGVALKLLACYGEDLLRQLVIMAEHPVRMAREAVALQAGIENRDLAAGAAELQRSRETGKGAADDNNVIYDVGSDLLMQEV